MTVSAFIGATIALYRDAAPSAHVRRADRQMAADLYRQEVSLEIIAAALILAVARRRGRDPQAQPLPPIRSLRYFLPVVAELRANPPAPGYLDYLRIRLAASHPRTQR
jgi:hypothetical protein